jgi:hypothetical protein
VPPYRSEFKLLEAIVGAVVGIPRRKASRSTSPQGPRTPRTASTPPARSWAAVPFVFDLDPPASELFDPVDESGYLPRSFIGIIRTAEGA